MDSTSVSVQLFALSVLGMPVASIAWTVTHEEVFRELRDYCTDRSQSCRRLYQRKFFYLLTCEYCFSHYIAAVVVAMTGFHLLYPDWRGYAIAWLSVVWIANVYMSLFGRLRLDIRRERVEIAEKQEQLDEQ